MAMNYQHRWGQTEDKARYGRKRQPASAPTGPSGLAIAACTSCGHTQSAYRLADFGCSRCGAKA